MLIQIDKNHSMKYVNDYFIVYVYKLNEKRKLMVHIKTKTYPDLITAWTALKEQGVDCDKIMQVGAELLDNQTNTIIHRNQKSC